MEDTEINDEAIKISVVATVYNVEDDTMERKP